MLAWAYHTTALREEMYGYSSSPEPSLGEMVLTLFAAVGISVGAVAITTALTPVVAAYPGLTASVIYSIVDALLKGDDPAKAAKEFGVSLTVTTMIEKGIRSLKEA